MLSGCDKCTTYQPSASPSDGDTFNYEQHVIQYTACETEKTNDDLQASQNQKTVVTFDLQQILQYPKVKGAKQLFYKSRMVLYNLCFFVKNTKQGYCYCWTQVEGLKGGNEISMCLVWFVRDHLSDHQHVVFWSNNCPR